MAQGTVRKGFFFYFGLFILLLFSIFMVCLVVMMFNPGATVLWMKYFTSSSVSYVEKTSDNQTLSYSTITDLTINCNYANVSVLANNEPEYANGDGIYVINKAKGFAVANGAKDFGYTIKKEGTEYILDLTEPSGFLFFSKDVQIVLNAHAGSWDLSKLNLTINGKDDCDVYLGGTSAIDEKDVSLASANIETETGDIIFNKKFITTSVKATSSFVSNSGKIESIGNQMNFGGADITFGTNSGRLNLESLNVGTKELYLKNKKGSIAVDQITADIVNINCSQGNFRFKKVVGDVSFGDSIDTIISPVIDIDEIQGDFYLDALRYENSSPTIKIAKVSGDLVVYSTKGSLNAKQISGIVDIQSKNDNGKGNMSVDIVIENNNISNIYVVNQTGNVKVGFKGSISNNVELKTLTSKIDVYFTSVAKFNARARNNEDTEDLAEDKIKISIADSGIYTFEKKSDIFVNGTGGGNGNIAIFSNGQVSYNLVESVE